MLVATRDPMHSPGAHDPSSPHGAGLHGHGQPRSARFVTLLQMAGSLLAIPVALGSAYSVYQANFSPDTQCQQLRANIISMIDKKIDAATRRMLVRRDVEAFEKSCGGFDPDAKAAFGTLLAAQPLKVPGHAATPKADTPKAEVVKAEPVKTEAAKSQAAKSDAAKSEATKSDATKPEIVKTETPAKEAARKVEPRATAAAKPAAVAVAEPEAAPDAAVSDARWLDAVRGALVTHDAAREAATANAATRAPVLKSTLTPAPLGALPAAAARATAAPEVAPALPPATAVATPAATQPPRDADHPVPPGAIPDAPPLDIASAAAGRPRSTWISNIPFVGRVLDK